MKTIEELSDYEKIVFRAIEEAHSLSVDETLDIIEQDGYVLYEVEDFDELIEIMIDEGLFGEIPSNLRGYLDYERIARDLEIDGFILTSVGVIIID